MKNNDIDLILFSKNPVFNTPHIVCSKNLGGIWVRLSLFIFVGSLIIFRGRIKEIPAKNIKI